MFKSIAQSATIVLAASVLTVPAFAGSKVAEKLENAKITLQQAIDLAEKETGGRAYEAEIEKNSFNVEYEVDVYVVAEGKRFEVSVDAKTGEVLSVREDR